MDLLQKIFSALLGTPPKISSKEKKGKVMEKKETPEKVKTSEEPKEKKDKSEKSLAPAKFGIDEMNYSYMSIGVVSDKTVRKTIHREWKIRTKTGDIIKQSLTIEPGVDTGTPTAFDMKAWVALQNIAADHDPMFTEEWIPFSLWQVCKIIGLPQEKQNRDRIRLSLRRLTTTTYRPESAFWDNGKKAWKPFFGEHHLITSYWLGSDKDDPEPPPDLEAKEGVAGYFSLDPFVRKSLQQKYRKRINLPLYFSFKSNTAAELYRFLNKQMGRRQEYKLDIMELVPHIGLSSVYRYPSDVWDKLKPALKELKEKEFLASYGKRSERWQGKRHVVVWFKRTLQSTKSEGDKPKNTT